jgi:hypothetical protein
MSNCLINCEYYIATGDYQIVTEEVKRKIAFGWEPLGCVSIAVKGENTICYAQTMIRRV